MDTTKAVTHVSLCAGYGGIDLGLKRAIPDLRTIAFAEIEAFACANLVAKMEAGQLDPAPIWTDLKTFPWRKFHGCVDILSGGYPCQPFSAAGKRLGADDPRHLWPFIADGIAAMRPAVCFFENVEGHISLGLEQVLRDLQGLSYRCTFGVFSASEVGAPHQRKRLFILAHRLCERGQLPNWWRFAAEQIPVGDGTARRDGLAVSIQPGPQGSASEPLHTRGLQRETGRSCNVTWPSRPGRPQFPYEPPRVVGDTESQRSPAQRAKHEGLGGELCCASSSSESESNGRQTEPALGGDADGSAGRLDYAELCVSGDSRVDELRLLGNGVVPATAERAFNVLASRLFS